MDSKDWGLDPYDYYEKYLKDAIRKNAEAYFDALIRDSKTDVKKARQDSAEYRKAIEKDKANEKVLARWSFLFYFLLVLAGICLLFAIGGIVGLAVSRSYFLLSLLSLIFGLVFGIAILIIEFKAVKKKTIALTRMDQENDREVAKRKALCLQGLYGLHHRMDYRDFNNIVRNTTSALTLDDTLKPETLQLLADLYQYDPKLGQRESLFTCLSGSLSQNPFLRLRVLSEAMRDRVYTGSITITWTERVGSGKDAHYVTRSEVLTAHVTHPAPNYEYTTAVIYGNEAAPNLTFTRVPSGLGKASDEKDVEHLVHQREKMMAKKSEEAIKDGRGFQPLANTEFEALFGAFDRNDEVEYRLLFTPLAQQNMVELLKSKEPYGDDFFFRKLHKVNVVTSRHGPLVPDFQRDLFVGETDIDALRKTYVDTIAQIFASLYFELAPIMAIPLYQQHDAGDYRGQTIRHVSDYEAESLVNHMEQSQFAHPETTTPQILKVRFRNVMGQSDVFDVESYSFRGDPKVTYVEMPGGDGRTHSVPVEWVDYVPLEKHSTVCIRKTDLTEDGFERMMKERASFFAEKAYFRNVVLNKNFVGFYLQDGYNYPQEDDDALTGVIDPFSQKGEK